MEICSVGREGINWKFLRTNPSVKTSPLANFNPEIHVITYKNVKIFSKEQQCSIWQFAIES